MTIEELAELYILQDQHVKELEEEVKVAKGEKENLMEMLAEEMLAKEVQSINKSGRTLYLSETVSATVPADRKDLLMAALTENGYGDIIKPSVSSQTLTALVKELSGEEEVMVPEWLDGIVNLYKAPKVGIRKSAKK